MKPIGKTLATLLALLSGTGIAIAVHRLLGDTDLCAAILYLLAIVTAVALIFIWTKDMEISTETRTIKVTWDKHQDSDEPDLPDYIQIPADLPDEDVYLYLTKHYGYTPISWENLK